MTDVYPVPPDFAGPHTIDAERLAALNAQALADPEGYWAAVGRKLDWIRPFTQVKDVNYEAHDFRIRWYHDGLLNVSANCLDRHLAERGDKTAINFEADEPGQSRRISYAELHAHVVRLAEALARLGITTGDRVAIYLPMIPEAAIAMLACARLGATHTVIFGGFSPDSVAGRIEDCGCKLVITADAGLRGSKRVPLKANVDKALSTHALPTVRHVVVVKHTGEAIDWHADRDRWYDELIAASHGDCPPVAVEAEHPLFILYTSGSTGKPKGVVHSSAGYLAYAQHSFELVFDFRPDDVFWCTADVGWVTGHSYIVYGPLAAGATVVMFEGVPSYPTPARFWEVIDEHRVTVFYTAPTAIRALMREGERWVTATSRESLRLLGSVGEPINPEAWRWYHQVVGGGRLPIVDTWWQTETGGVLMSPVPGATALKPGSATRPLPGILPALVDAAGQRLEGAAEGNLVLLDSWPGQARGVYGDLNRFIETYFRAYPGTYFTGDGCRRDADGDYWITGRVDDVINVSGHRIGTAEVESALVAHAAVAEAAVVGYPHDLKGQGIYAYVTLKSGVEASSSLQAELVKQVRSEIGPIATPDVIQWAPGLPKTRSGKIMRRILRKIAENQADQLGDLSTLAEPLVVGQLVEAAARLRG